MYEEVVAILTDRLIQTGERLVKRFHTRDPYNIADGLGIQVLECPDFGTLKGMYTVIKRNRFIFLNQDLDEHTKRIVLAHEIGHDQLHRSLVKSGSPIQEFTLYDIKSRPEYEANIICSEILLDCELMLKYIYEDHYTAEQIAAVMDTDVNLVALKASHLMSLGYPLNYMESKNDFLK